DDALRATDRLVAVRRRLRRRVGVDDRAALLRRGAEEIVGFGGARVEEAVRVLAARARADPLPLLDVEEVNERGACRQHLGREREAELSAVERVAQEVEVVHRL